MENALSVQTATMRTVGAYVACAAAGPFSCRSARGESHLRWPERRETPEPGPRGRLVFHTRKPFHASRPRDLPSPRHLIDGVRCLGKTTGTARPRPKISTSPPALVSVFRQQPAGVLELHRLAVHDRDDRGAAQPQLRDPLMHTHGRQRGGASGFREDRASPRARGRAHRRVRSGSGGPGGCIARRRREAPWSWASTDDNAARRRPVVASRTSLRARLPRATAVATKDSGRPARAAADVNG
jgi:hypothetical protein